MSKRLVFILFILANALNIFAQNDTLTKNQSAITWSKIPEEDLKMTLYSPDSSAQAVVLGAKGIIKIWIINNIPIINFRLFRRVKLFKKSAFDSEGNIKISCYTQNDYERILHIMASVIQPDGSRQVWTEKDFIQDKTSAEVTTFKFAFPNLQEGSIIQYEYEMVTKNLITLHDWLFQEDIPVRHSELTLSLPIYKLKYVDLIRNRKYIKYLSDTSTSMIATNKFWVDSLPALKQEGYITTMSDYLTRIHFQLRYYVQSYVFVQPYLASWKALAESIVNNNFIGKQITKRKNYSDIWETIKPLLITAKTDDEKIKIIYKYLCKNISWENNSYSIYSDKTLNDAFKKKKARSGELNMMLLACLSEAGIKAFPMLISTREHGKPIMTYPILEQFNHLVAYVDRGEKSFIVDVSNINRPVGMPRIATLNEQGLLLDKDNSRWLPIVPPCSSEETLLNLDLQENGTLKGSILSSYDGYSAVSERDNEEGKHEKIKQELAATFLDIEIDSIKIDNLNNTEEPFKRTVFCAIPNAAVAANNLIYIKPTLKSDFETNPFKQPKRDYPIDFAYPIHEEFILNLTFPKDYILEEMPKETTVLLLKNSGSFQYLSTQKENSVQIIVKIKIGQLHFEPEGYAIVKDFFNQIAIKLAEQIVLKKKI
jgi:Domain of Unknown Function with PDB structure (DUF3857)